MWRTVSRNSKCGGRHDVDAGLRCNVVSNGGWNHSDGAVLREKNHATDKPLQVKPCHLLSPRISNLGYSFPRQFKVLSNNEALNGGMSNLEIINSFIFSMLPTYKAGNAEQQTNER